MPFGIKDPVVGGAAFLAIKFAGYSFAASRISKHYSDSQNNIYAVGAARTLIGVLFGTLYFTLASVGVPGVLILLGLIPIRVIEWLLLLKIFYDRPLEKRSKAQDVVVLGTIWSFVLDIPAIIGFIAVAGFWVC